MSELINQYFFKPLAVIALILAILWVVLDAGTKLIVSNESESAIVTDGQMASFEYQGAKYDDVDKIASLYSRYIPQEPKPEPVVTQPVEVPSPKEQANQKGNLDKVFVGRNALTLKAIISDSSLDAKKATVLIEIINVDTNAITIQRLLEQERIYDYLLKIDSNTRVRLIHENGNEIILTMYNEPK